MGASERPPTRQLKLTLELLSERLKGEGKMVIIEYFIEDDGEIHYLPSFCVKQRRCCGVAVAIELRVFGNGWNFMN